MSRPIKWIAGVGAGVCLLLALAVVGLRVSRHGYDAPEPVAGRNEPVMRLRNGFVDFYGARNGNRVLLFDTGDDPEGHGLDALLSSLHATREDVSDVFLTHGHGDHSAGAPLLLRARIHSGIRDADMLAHKAPMVPRLARLISFILPTPPVAITDAFIDPGEVPVGNGQSVLGVPLPGHTPGSFGYVYDGVLFTGDTLELSHDHLQLATGPFTVDPAAERRSVAALGRELRGVKIDFVCTGHQGCTRAGEAPRLLAELIARSGKSQ